MVLAQQEWFAELMHRLLCAMHIGDLSKFAAPHRPAPAPASVLSAGAMWIFNSGHARSFFVALMAIMISADAWAFCARMKLTRSSFKSAKVTLTAKWASD